MKKLYEKNELNFSLLWIGLYVVLGSMAENLSQDIGIQKIISVPVNLIISVIILVFINKNGLKEKYGLCKNNTDLKKYLYFIPLLILISANLWSGVQMKYSVLESVLHVVSMIGVGFLEEIIFRGFLFKAICKSNVKRAVIISSVTFGIGHIVNLLNGADTFSTICQICYAIAIGFLFTIIFLRSRNLIPCIITHQAVNSLSAFAGERSDNFEMILSVVLIVVSFAYSTFILIKTKPATTNNTVLAES
ncbi:MAG: CPBP family intramembrane metalloprotease [Ruminococcus flavefaciens]|nr:CPBP family intramembrane metalloprotease [Ruminococcus flavefaciens]